MAQRKTGRARLEHLYAQARLAAEAELTRLLRRRARLVTDIESDEARIMKITARLEENRGRLVQLDEEIGALRQEEGGEDAGSTAGV